MLIVHDSIRSYCINNNNAKNMKLMSFTFKFFLVMLYYTRYCLLPYSIMDLNNTNNDNFYNKF